MKLEIFKLPQKFGGYIWWILILSHFSRYTSGGLLTRLCQYTTENFSTDEKAHEVENFFKENHNPAERTIRQCVENITLNAKWHAKDGKSIRNYLGALWNLTLFWHNYWWPLIYWRKISCDLCDFIPKSWRVEFRIFVLTFSTALVCGNQQQTFKIRHVQIDELPRTLFNECFYSQYSIMHL